MGSLRPHLVQNWSGQCSLIGLMEKKEFLLKQVLYLLTLERNGTNLRVFRKISLHNFTPATEDREHRTTGSNVRLGNSGTDWIGEGGMSHREQGEKLGGGDTEIIQTRSDKRWS